MGRLVRGNVSSWMWAGTDLWPAGGLWRGFPPPGISSPDASFITETGDEYRKFYINK